MRGQNQLLDSENGIILEVGGRKAKERGDESLEQGYRFLGRARGDRMRIMMYRTEQGAVAARDEK